MHKSCNHHHQRAFRGCITRVLNGRLKGAQTVTKPADCNELFFYFWLPELAKLVMTQAPTVARKPEAAVALPDVNWTRRQRFG